MKKETNPSTQCRKRKRSWDEDDTFIRQKLATYLSERKELKLKPNCKLEDGKIWMQCVRCKIFKERIPTLFAPDHNGDNFASSPPGHEWLKNSKSRPCRTCYAEIQCTKTQSGDGFLNSLVSPYKKLNPELNFDWIKSQLQKQNNLGLITNFTMVQQANVANAVGIHRYNNKKEHTPKNCFLEVQELNVSQHDMIPSLFEAWKTVFMFMTSTFVLGYLADEVINFEEKSKLKQKFSCKVGQTAYKKTIRCDTSANNIEKCD